jgi:hypothetical protein
MPQLSLALLMLAGLLAAGTTEYTTVGGFLKRWGIWVLVFAGLVVAGIVVGEITRSAMCAGPWVCE